MKKQVIALATAIMMIPLFTACSKPSPAEDTVDYVAPQNAERYQNHIEIEGQWGSSAATGPNGQYGIGDPFVMRYNGKYYLYPSTSDPYDGVKVFESDDLVHWTYKGFAVPESEKAVHGAYAPEVVFYGGYFYLCESRAGKGHYIYRAESPTGPFSLVSKTDDLDPSDIDYGNLAMGIDGSFYVSDEGKLYILHTSSPAMIRYNEFSDLNNITKETMGQALPVREANLHHWIEGPGVFRRGDFTYVTYTGNHVGSLGYRVAYSYAENFKDFSELIQPRDNVTIMDTAAEHHALGHSSNVTGPDLDSVYTAYHNLVGGGPARRYNVDRYLASGSILTANGVTHRPVLVPSKPAAGGYAEALREQSGAYVIGTAENFFTAEYNFVPSEGQELLCGIYRIRVGNGKVSLLKNGNVVGEKEVAIPEGRLAVVRVENGDGVGHVYFNNMRLISYEAEEGGGLIGYTKNDNIGYTAFTNDVFGTSDFEAPKNFPTKFPATDYLKGEGRGFGIAASKRVKGGVRVGEKESIRRVDDANAVVLESGDWVKYAVDVEKDETFAVFAEVTRESEGAQLRFTNGTNILEATVPELGEGESKTVRVYLGTLKLAGGISSMKLEVLSGKAEITMLETAEFDAGENVSLETFTSPHGTATLEDGALAVKGEQGVALWEQTATVNFEATIGFTCAAAIDTDFGIMVRASHYSYFSAQPTQSWRGYYLQLNGSLITLYRYDYGNVGYIGLARTNGVDLVTAGAHTLVIRAEGHKFHVELDGVISFDAEDDCAFMQGALGVYAGMGELRITSLSFRKL